QGLLAQLSVETPVLLVLEDLQWADPSSRSLILSTARQLTGMRVVLVGTFRSDDLGRRHPPLPTLAMLERLPNVERIDLQRLTPAAVHEQIAGILGSVPAPRLVDEIVERSDGNPFFVEELLAGGPQPGRSGVPPTIQDVIEVRLNALPDETQRVVRIAAVVGRQAEQRVPPRAGSGGGLRRPPSDGAQRAPPTCRRGAQRAAGRQRGRRAI